MSAAVTADALDSQLGALLRLEQWALRDPYPIYSALREASPIHPHGSIVFLTKYDDVLAAFKDNGRILNRYEGARIDAIYAKLSEEDGSRYTDIRAYEKRQMVRMDEPEHSLNREIGHRAFTPRLIVGMREVVQRIVDGLLEPLDGNSPVDFVDVFAYRLPMLVIFEMLRVPADRREEVRTWSEEITRFRANPTNVELLHRAHVAHHEFAGLVREVLAANRQMDTDTNLSASLFSARDSGAISEHDVVTMVMMILFAGHETTTNLLANGLLALQRNPAQWRALVDDPSLAAAAVEECLRYDAPVQFLYRVAGADFDFRGVNVAAGHTLGLGIGAANRDPAQTENADSFDIRRSGARHLSFGFGIHFCIGSVLARMEGQIAFETLASRFPNLEVAVDELVFKPSANLRGPEELPVRLGQRTA